MGDDDKGKVYVGNIRDVSERELEHAFQKFGRIRKVWIARNPPGFGFVYFSDPRDAEDAVDSMNRRELHGKTICVEMSHARGSERRRGRERSDRDYNSRNGRLPIRTGYKVQITGFPSHVTWRELKDFIRRTAEATFVDIRDNEGLAEFATAEEMHRAIRELDNVQFEGSFIKVTEKPGGKDRRNSRSHDRSYRNSRSDRHSRRRSPSFKSRRRSRSRSKGRHHSSHSHSRSRSRSGSASGSHSRSRSRSRHGRH